MPQQFQIPDFEGETRQRAMDRQNAMALQSNLKTQGLMQNRMGMQNQDMAKEMADRQELEALLGSTPPEQRERVGLEFLKARDPEKAAKLQATYVNRFAQKARLDPKNAAMELENATGEKIEMGNRYSKLPIEGGEAYVDNFTGHVFQPNSAKELAQVRADLATKVEEAKSENRKELEILKSGLRPDTPKKQIERTVDLGDQVEYIYTDGTSEKKRKGLTPGQSATSSGGGKPRYVQYSAPDGSFSKMVNVNDPNERAEMEGTGWTPGAPAKMGATQQQALESTLELKDLTKEIRSLYKPGFTGKFDAGVKGNIQEFTGMIGGEQAAFRVKVQSLLNQVGNLRAGKAWTAQEIARLLREIPNVNMSDPVFNAAMQNLENTIEKKLQAVETVAERTGTRVNQPVNPDAGGGAGGGKAKFRYDPNTGQMVPVK